MARSVGSIHVADNSVTAINDAIQQLLFLLDELRGEHNSTTIRVGPHTHSVSTQQGSGTGGLIDHDDLTNVTIDQHHARDHASRHSNGGGDEISVENLGTAQNNPARILNPDGAGGLTWNPDYSGFVEGSTQEQPWENIIAGTNITITEQASGNAIKIDASGSGSAHDLLDGSQNQDTTASTVTAGDLIYGNSTPAWDDLPIGSNGEVLQVSGGLPAWGSPPAAVEATDIANIEASTQEQPWENILAGSNITITELANGNAISIASTGGSSGLNIWNPDNPPSSAGADDDEFADASGGVPGGWTEVDHGTTITVGEDSAGLTILQTAGTIGGIYKAIPAGDFSIWSKVSMAGLSGTDQAGMGLALFEDATNSAGDIVTFFPVFPKNTQDSAFLFTWSAYNAFASTLASDFTINALNGSYCRIRRNGTTYAFDFSNDGLCWVRLYSSTISFTPTHYGIVCYNATGTSLTGRAQFFRYVSSDVGLAGLMSGRRN